MKGLFATRSGFSGLVLRLFLAVVFFPHGAQKVLGWFGGYGFTGTLNFFTTMMHVPMVLALAVFAAEFLGPIALVVGFLTRLAALGILLDMIGAVAMIHAHNGFFMNWAGKTPPVEGFEFHLLAIAIALALIIGGAGELSVDKAIAGEDA
jgi:putative oxidoreductase